MAKGARQPASQRAGGGDKQLEGVSAEAARLSRISKTSILDLNESDVFAFLLDAVPAIQPLQSFWRLTGSALVQFGATTFVQALQSEFYQIPRTTCIEIFTAIQSKIIRDAASKSVKTPHAQDYLLNQWANTAAPASSIVQPGIPPTIPAGLNTNTSTINPLDLMSIFLQTGKLGAVQRNLSLADQLKLNLLSLLNFNPLLFHQTQSYQAWFINFQLCRSIFKINCQALVTPISHPSLQLPRVGMRCKIPQPLTRCLPRPGMRCNIPQPITRCLPRP